MVNATTTLTRGQNAGTRPKPYLVTEIYVVLVKQFSRNVGEEPQ